MLSRGCRTAVTVAAGIGFGLFLPPAVAFGDDASAELVLTVDRAGSASLWLDMPVAGPDSNLVAQVVRGYMLCDLQMNEGEAEGFIAAECPRLLQRNGWIVSGRVELANLLKALRQIGVSSLRVRIAHPTVGFTRCSLGEPNRWAPDSEVQYTHVFAVGGDVSSSSIDLQFGYRARDVLLAALVLGLALAVPIGFAVGLERTSRQLPESEPEHAAVTHPRYLRNVRWGTWVAWTLPLLLLRHWDFLHFVIDPKFPTTCMLLLVGGFLVPPALATVIAEAALAPISQRARGTLWSTADILRQAAWRQVSLVVPLTLFATGLFLAKVGHLIGVLPWVAAALIVRTESHWRLWAAHDFIPEALTVGDLRDRAFALAAKAKVALDQVFVLAGSKGKHANAFATHGRFIMITDYLIQHLSREEIDGIVAHELAHLRGRHPLLFTAQWGAVWVALAVAGLVIAALTRSAAPLLGVPIFAAMAIAALRRRSEAGADLEAASLIGNPEAFIRALVKTGQLNGHPLLWGREDFISHPSTLRRIQAIAQAHGISEARLQELLAPSTGIGMGYSIPRGARPGETVYSSGDRQRASRWFSSFVLATLILTPVLVASTTRGMGLAGPRLWIAYAAGLVAGLVLLLGLDNVLPVVRYEDWRRRLDAKARGEGVQPQECGGTFVGLSLADSPQIYDGNGDWDLGFLFLGFDRLSYWGERMSFAVRREDVVGARLGPGVVATWATDRVYLTWRDATGTHRTLNFRPAAARSMRAIVPLAQALRSRLSKWMAGTDAGPVLPAALRDLPAPEVREITSKPSSATRPALLVRALLWSAFLATSASLALDLPFRSPAKPSWLGPGTYVVACALLFGLFQWIPVRVTRATPSESPSLERRRID